MAQSTLDKSSYSRCSFLNRSDAVFLNSALNSMIQEYSARRTERTLVNESVKTGDGGHGCSGDSIAAVKDGV